MAEGGKKVDANSILNKILNNEDIDWSDLSDGDDSSSDNLVDLQDNSLGSMALDTVIRSMDAVIGNVTEDVEEDCIISDNIALDTASRSMDAVLANVTEDDEQDGAISDDERDDPDYVPGINDSIDSVDSVTNDAEQTHDQQLPDEVLDIEHRPRKRKSNTNIWTRVIRKKNRVSGNAYVTTKGIDIAPRSEGDGCRCKKKCFEIINKESREILFKDYYKLKDDTAHDAFLFSCMRRSPVLRRYIGRQEPKRSCSFYYFLKVDGIDRNVCKIAFCSILGITRHKVEYLQIKMKAGNTTPGRSGRGLHDSRPNKTPYESLQEIRDHINSIPRYVSHYSRTKNPDKRYLSPELNLSRLYDDFKKQCESKGKPVPKEWKYRDVFNHEFNLGFGAPRSDTCKTCDLYKYKLAAMDNTSETESIKREWEKHQRHAEKAFSTLKEDRAAAKDDKADARVISFDLQQALPTPYITTGIAFYKRQLWTYNTGIHDCGTEKGYMCVWSEDVAGRGASEIGSCLLKYFDSVDIPQRHLIAYSDSCGGQNKNRHILALWSYLIQQGRFDQIEHKFPVSGHSFLPSDTDFSHIEKEKRRRNHVYLPTDWHDVIRKARKNNPFTVFPMDRTMIFNLERISKNLTFRKKTTDGQKVEFINIRWFRLSKETPNQYDFRYTLSNMEGWKTVNLTDRGEIYAKSPITMVPKYNAPRKIKRAKLQDLIVLCNYIPMTSRGFYKSLKPVDDDETVELVY